LTRLSDEEKIDEKQQLIEKLSSEHGIPVETAEACLIAAGWDLDTAVRLAGLNKVEYLLINLRYTGKNPLPHGGLVSILLKEHSNEPEQITGMALDGFEYIEDISPHLPASDFVKAIVNPAKHRRDNSPWLSLRQTILIHLTKDAVTKLFSLSSGKTVEIGPDGKVADKDPLKEAILGIIRPPIDELFMESVRLEASVEFLNGFQHDNLRDIYSTDKLRPEEDTEAEPKKTPDAFKVHLKGRLVIDAHHGVVVEDLQIGDIIICDIIDPSPVATEVGKMLGVYRNRVWFPAKGKIDSIEDSLSGTKRITMRAGQGIYIVATALSSVRVKASENSLDSILRRIELQRDESVRSALGLLPLALVILGVALALTILLQKG
jgi:hypothetical protein